MMYVDARKMHWDGCVCTYRMWGRGGRVGGGGWGEGGRGLQAHKPVQEPALIICSIV